MEQTDHWSLGPVPSLDRLSCRVELYAASLAMEIVRRFLRQFDQAALAGADDQQLSSLLTCLASSSETMCEVP